MPSRAAPLIICALVVLAAAGAAPEPALAGTGMHPASGPGLPPSVRPRAFLPSTGKAATLCQTRYPMMVWGYVNNSSNTLLDLTNEIGANVSEYFPYWPAPEAIDIPLLDQAQAHGLRLVARLEGAVQQITSSSFQVTFTNWLNAVKGHPALYGFHIYDEPEIRQASEPVSVQRVKQTIDLVRQIDPAHPTVLNFARILGSPTTNYVPYIGLADIAAFDYYPVSGSGTYRTSMTEYETLVDKFVSDHATYDKSGKTQMYVTFVQAFQNALLGLPEPTQDQMQHQVNYARSKSLKFGGLVYFLNTWPGQATYYPALLERQTLRAKALGVSNTMRSFGSRYPLVDNAPCGLNPW